MPRRPSSSLKNLKLGNVRLFGQMQQLTSKCKIVVTDVDKANLALYNSVNNGTAPFPSTSFSVRLNETNDPQRRRHGNKRNENPTDCLFCGKTFQSWTELERHMRVHTKEQPYSCPTCQRSFSQRYNLQTHILVMHSRAKKKYGCNLCGKRFHLKYALKEHTRRHMSDKPHRCDICQKSFVSSQELTVHRRIHMSRKPLKCILCGKRFAQKGALNVHVRVHTNERPYKCSWCHKFFKSNSSLYYHLKSKLHLKNVATSFAD